MPNLAALARDLGPMPGDPRPVLATRLIGPVQAALGGWTPGLDDGARAFRGASRPSTTPARC